MSIVDNTNTQATTIGGSPSITEMETGHPTMLDRVRAMHRMVTGLLDEWEEYVAAENGRPPKWCRELNQRTFFKNIADQFDIARLEELNFSRHQYFYLKDLYDRSL